MRQSVTYKEKSEGFANQTFRLLLVGRSRSGFSSPDSDTNYTLGLAVETITVSSMKILLGQFFWLFMGLLLYRLTTRTSGEKTI